MADVLAPLRLGMTPPQYPLTQMVGGYYGMQRQRQKEQELRQNQQEIDNIFRQSMVRDPQTGRMKLDDNLAYSKLMMAGKTNAALDFMDRITKRKATAKGMTQGPAGQIGFTPDGRALLLSRDPNKPYIIPLTIQGMEEETPRFLKEGDMFPDENGFLQYRAPGTNTTVPVLSQKDKKPIKDPKVMAAQEETKIDWANLGLAQSREQRAQEQWEQQIPPREKQMTGKMRVSQSLEGLRRFYTNLNQMGGLPNVDNNIFSNIWASTKSSWLGQTLGKKLGTKEQSVRDMILSSRPLLVQYIRQASEMGARGMDSEQELKFYLMAATDPADMSYQSNLNAIKMLDQAYGLGSMQGAPTFNVNKVLDEFLKKEAPGIPAPAPTRETVPTDADIEKMTKEQLEEYLRE